MIAIVAGIAGAVAFPSLRPGLRATLAFAFGGLALVNGVMHVGHIATDGPAHSDLTGVLAAIAGAVLIGLAATIPWRHRRELATSTRRRWTIRVLTVPAALAGMIFVLGPIGMAIVETHKWREPIGAPPSAAYRDVSFKASDGLDIARLVPPVARTAPRCSSCTGAAATARAPSRMRRCSPRHGYGVLLYDARGRGESDGTPNGYGWDWGKDVAGALDFLAQRDDVDPQRIGALGLSTGADVLIEVAAERDDVARAGHRRCRRRLVRGLEAAPRHRARDGPRLDDVHGHAGDVGRPARPAARGPDRPRAGADAADLRRHGRGA